MKNLAIDLGKFKSVACVYESSTGEHSFVTVATKPGAIHDLLTTHEPQRMMIEIGSAAGWVYDLALTMGLPIQIANPNHEAWRWKNVKRTGCVKGESPIPLRSKLSIAIPAVLLGFLLGATVVYWCFNGNTRPWRFQSGVQSVHGTTGERTFDNVVFVAPPEITFSGRHDSNGALKSTSVLEATTKGFTWRNVGDTAESDGGLDFEARGRISREQAEKLGITWTVFSSWQLW